MVTTDRPTELVQNGDSVIETFIDGTGPAVLIVPSFGRDGAGDLDDFARLIAAAGFKVLRPRPRGIGRSSGSMNASLQDMADDAAIVIQRLVGENAVVMGHAFGTYVASLLATTHPEAVRGTVLATGPGEGTPKDIAALPFIAGNPALPESERLQALSRGFFAPHHDARMWLNDWYPETLQMQKTAFAATDASMFYEAGTAPILQIFAESDPFNPFSSWRQRREKLGARVTARIIADASHALFPEQTPAVAEIVIRWLRTLDGEQSLSNNPEDYIQI